MDLTQTTTTHCPGIVLSESTEKACSACIGRTIELLTFIVGERIRVEIRSYFVASSILHSNIGKHFVRASRSPLRKHKMLFHLPHSEL